MRKSSINRRSVIILALIVVVVIAGYLFSKPVYLNLTNYLSKNERVSADILLVEGWLPEYAIESVKNEFQRNGYRYIITTGLRSTGDYYMLSMNGKLVFYPGKRFSSDNESRKHSIAISAYSELGGRDKAHFKVCVNDSVVADYFAGRRKKDYTVSWVGKLEKVDSIMVEFDNDHYGESGDCNLYVKDVRIDNLITIPYLNNSVYNISDNGFLRRVTNDFASNAQLTRNRLISAGIDSSSILAIPAAPAKVNRTLASALAVRDWMKSPAVKVDGINIISEGTHSRRTWMTYEEILGRSARVGIIAFDDYANSQTRRTRLLYVSRQTLALVYYWFILQFYRA